MGFWDGQEVKMLVVVGKGVFVDVCGGDMGWFIIVLSDFGEDGEGVNGS